MVPVVEPEILIDGTHSIEKSYAVTEKVLRELFAKLEKENVALEFTILKPSMVISGKQSKDRASVDEVATQTVKCLIETVPSIVPPINFLSGGQTPQESTAHLNRMHTIGAKLPWNLSFSYARALQEPALKAWMGKERNLEKGQRAFLKRAELNSLASIGKYSIDLE